MKCRLLPVLILVLAAGCAGPGAHQDEATLSRQDSLEALEIKAALIEELGISGSAIDVTVEEGQVILEGFVETRQQSQRAEDIAQEQSDAGRVDNRITVK
ncbi:BON domain-containing protein [Marinobacter sp.]|uniref:BON domain-containing protein n=1 Tax=Marinobacter sp. TaxID=50741 RepID=UPI00385114E2